MTDILGLDIGGANLKAAHTRGGARLRPFALWKQPDFLAEELRDLLAGWPPFARLAVTMTGELCDCFATRREGVLHILGTVEMVARDTPVDVWHTDGQFHSPAETRVNPLGAAAANWLVLATFAGRFVPHGPALVIDVGSTTTDIVAMEDGRPIPQALTDYERLRTSELIYTGVRRTPLCALLGRLVAAEFFSTTLDAYLFLGRLPENPSDSDTADGRPVTRARAEARLARQVCADLEVITTSEIEHLATQTFNHQRWLLREAFEVQAARLSGVPTACLAGSGEFLAREAWLDWRGGRIHSLRSLANELGPDVSAAAPAYAVAVLAAERAP